MNKYEVTIKFKKIPWYTGYCMARDELQATLEVNADARQMGFHGANSGVEVKLMK